VTTLPESPPLPIETSLPLSGPLSRQIWRLFWPAFLAMLFETANTVANVFWVGHLGTEPVAGVISSMFILWLAFSLLNIVISGVIATVARSLGAGRPELARHYATQAFFFALSFGTAVGGGTVLFGEHFFRLMRNEANVAALGYRYLAPLSAFLPFLFGAETVASIFRASGDAKTPMLVTSSALIFNILVNPLLIFGIGPFPRLEVSGAGLSTGIAYMAELSAFLILIQARKPVFAPRPTAKIKPDLKVVAEIVKIGLPISISGIAFTIVYLFLDNLASSFGVFALAALGFGNRIESISFLTCFAFSVAAATLMGQYLGAKDPDTAQKAAYRITLYASMATGILTVVFLFLPYPIVRLFSSDPPVVEAAVAYLRIIAVSQIFMGFEIVLEGAFSGSGDTLPAMLISVPGSLARIPLAYFFAQTLNWGVPGIWWAITLTTLVRGSIMLFWFSRGGWKKKKVAGLSAV